MLNAIRAWMRRRAWIKAWRAALASGLLTPAQRAEYQARLDHALGVKAALCGNDAEKDAEKAETDGLKTQKKGGP